MLDKKVTNAHVPGQRVKVEVGQVYEYLCHDNGNNPVFFVITRISHKTVWKYNVLFSDGHATSQCIETILRCKLLPASEDNPTHPNMYAAIAEMGRLVGCN